MATRSQSAVLCSVFDKTGIVEFAAQLHDRFGVRLLATGGTAKVLQSANLFVEEISDLTGTGEMYDGLVKTLQWQLYAGILAPEADIYGLMQANLPRIGIVAVNLYDLEKAKATHANWREVVKHGMDVGGPALLRAAVKSECATPIVDPADYKRVLNALIVSGGLVPLNLKLELSVKAMLRISRYDADLAEYLKDIHKEVKGPPS